MSSRAGTPATGGIPTPRSVGMGPYYSVRHAGICMYAPALGSLNEGFRRFVGQYFITRRRGPPPHTGVARGHKCSRAMRDDCTFVVNSQFHFRETDSLPATYRIL